MEKIKNVGTDGKFIATMGIITTALIAVAGFFSWSGCLVVVHEPEMPEALLN